MQHEDVDPLTPGNRIDRGRAGIAAGRADNGQVIIAARQEGFEQQPQHLQGDILECQRWAVEQFKQPLLFVELLERGHGGMGKAAIGSSAQLAQLVLRQAVSDERGHDPRGKLCIRQPGHRGDLAFGKARPFSRDIKPAIIGQTCKGYPFEIERRRASSCRNILHRSARLAAAARLGKRGALYPAIAGLWIGHQPAFLRTANMKITSAVSANRNHCTAYDR